MLGHKYGPYSNKTREIVRQCDEDLGYLLDEIDRNPRLRNHLHLIVTSDHGLEQVNDTKQAMLLDDYVNMTQIKAFGTETVVNIFLQSGKISLLSINEINRKQKFHLLINQSSRCSLARHESSFRFDN